MLGAELALLLALSQQPQKPDTVALIIAGQARVVATVEAEAWYERLEMKRRLQGLSAVEEFDHGALVVALGTIRQDTVQCHNGVRENWVGELFTCGN